MTIGEIESEALRLNPSDRVRLAERLLDSLETLSKEENARIWADEAERRDRARDANGNAARSASEVFRNARARLAR